MADLGSGRTLDHDRGGTGEPVLLIMGMSGHMGLWRGPFLDALRRECDVVMYDHRGIGASSRADEPFTIADLATDAAGVLDAVGWGSAHVVGISMGGMVAQELAASRRDRVRTLTLGCTYAGPDGGTLDSPGAGRMLQAMLTRDPDAVTRAAFEVNLSSAWRDRDGAYEEFRAVTLAAKAPLPVVAMQAQAARAHDAVARLRALDVPTLVIHGSADELIAPRNGAHVAGLVPGARLAVLDGVGHLFWIEEPLRSAELILDHVRAAGRQRVE